MQQFQDNGDTFPLLLSDLHAQQRSIRYSSSKKIDPIGGTIPKEPYPPFLK